MQQNSTNPSDRFKTEKIGKLLWSYTLPAMIGTVVMSLYNIVDRIFIGHGVGSLAISGLATTFPFMLIMMAFGLLIGVGASTRISITLGQNDLAKAEKILGNSLTLTLIITGTATLFGMFFMEDLLRLFGGTSNTLEYAKDYLKIIIPGGVLTALYFGLNNIMRASGYPKKAMFNIILGAVINIILDPIFIFIFDWGIEGAAIATIISYLIGTINVVSHFFLRTTALRIQIKNLKLEGDTVKSILNIGLSPFIMQLGTSLVVVFINQSLLKYGGDLAIGAYGIINSINMLVIMFIIGLNQGSQPIIGFNFGAGNYPRMFKTLKYSVIIGTILSTMGFLIGTILPHYAVNLFTSDQKLQEIASNALRISVIMFPTIGYQIVISNFFQSIGKAKLSIFLSLMRQIIFVIPTVSILPLFFGLNGVWATTPVSDGLSFLVATATFGYFYKKFKNNPTPTI